MTMTELISGDENARNVARAHTYAHTRTHTHTQCYLYNNGIHEDEHCQTPKKSSRFITTGTEPATIQTLPQFYLLDT
jgi:hypothetical protein